MFRLITLVGVVFAVTTITAADDIVTRAEKTELKRSDQTVVQRVVRDAQGNVTELTLNDMTLSEDDVKAIGNLPELRRLVLFHTNFTDGGLAQLRRLKKIESLNLTDTAVTGKAIDDLLQLPTLKYLCLGNVDISPDAVARLKEQTRARGQNLQLGYSQKK